MAGNPITALKEDPVYFAKRSGIYMAGKTAVHEIKENLNGEVIGMAQWLLPALGTTAPVLIGLGLTAAVSAGLTQMDYYHQRNRIRDVYKEEAAAKLKKPPEKVRAADLDWLAQSNNTIAEELAKSQRQRNYNIGMSFLSSMASLAIVTIGVASMLAGNPGILGEMSETWAHVAKIAIGAVAGLISYNAVKIPLHWLGDKLFNLDEHTTHDRILSLSRDREQGKIISGEQVLGIFADANPAVGQRIADRYGDSFDQLPLAGKKLAVEELSALLPLQQLTNDINSGKISPAELAFAVEGDVSGARHRPGEIQPKSGMFSGLMSRLRSAAGLKPHLALEVRPLTVAAATPHAVAMVYEEEGPRRSFVKALGLERRDTARGYVERLEKSRSEQVALTSLN